MLAPGPGGAEAGPAKYLMQSGGGRTEGGCDSFAPGWWCDSFAPHNANAKNLVKISFLIKTATAKTDSRFLIYTPKNI